MKTPAIALSFLALLLAAPLVRSAEPYPLTTCVVSGEKLDEMGQPVVINYKGTEVHFCCKACIEKFNANPALYLAKLKAAQKAKQ